MVHRKTALVASLLILAITSCASVIAQHPQPSTFITLAPGGAESNPEGVAPLHVKVPADRADVDFVLAPGREHQWIIEPSDKGASFHILVNPGPGVKEDRLIATVWNWDNRPVAQEICSNLRPHDLDITVKGLGIYLITLDGYRKEEHAYRMVRSFAVLPANKNAQARWKDSDYWLGICAFPGRYHWSSGGKPTKPDDIAEEKAREIEADAMAKLGLTVARLDVSMVLPEKETSNIDWKRMDAAVSAYTSRGFELALQLMHPPDWAIEDKYAAETKDRWRFPRQENPYRRYVREIVSRYGKHAKFVQIYNEPDQLEFWAASQEAFITEVDRAREEIRKVMPATPIANGGYAFIDPKRTEYFTRELKGKLDLAAYHSHGNLRELKRDMDQMRSLHKEAGYDKPRFINTECGFAAWRLDQERSQAASVVQKIVYSWAHGDEGMLLFASRMTKAPGRSGRDFGFLDYDFCPRFVYGCVAGFVDVHAGARFKKTLVEDGNVHAYLFTKGSEHIVTGFSIGETATLVIATDAREVTLVDAMGNRTRGELDQGRVRIKVGALVQSVVFEGSTRVEVLE